LIIEFTETYGWKSALRAMRNPMDSWAKSDSYFNLGPIPDIGPDDLVLAKKLVLAGSEHAKFTRMIGVSADFVLPLFLWNEFDTYKVGVTRLSCSSMHRLGTRALTSDDFEGGLVDPGGLARLNALGDEYRASKSFELRYQMRAALPWSYLQRSTIATNYAALRGMYFQRRDHRLPQWWTICAWIESLPYAAELITVRP
jgi:hypothetical protein